MTENSISSKSRIEWIDTAKGICISLVVLHHVFASYCMYGQSGFLSHIYYSLQSFRIPLYFILSGIFFKSYGCIKNHVIKKTNKILIPCIFFYLTLSILFPYLMMAFGDDIYCYSKKTFLEVLTAIFFMEGLYPNGPIWFLLCLFQVNIIFCIFQYYFKTMKGLVVVSIVMGCIGMFLSNYNINLYCNTDSAFTGIPFFCFGYYLNKETNYISNGKPKFVSLLVFLAFSLLTIYLLSRNAEFNFNKFANKMTVYPCGLIGSLLILSLSKYFRRIRFVSYWGRYSLIILSSHYIMIDVIYRYFPTYINKWFICFLLIMFSYYLIIPLFVKYLPYVTAQKELIKL